MQGSDGIRQKNGKKLKVALQYLATSAEDKLLCAAMQSALKEIGIDMVLQPMEEGALDSSLEDKGFDMMMNGQWYVPSDDPSFHYVVGYWHSDATYPIYTSPELDKLVEKLDKTMDSKKRLTLHHQVQKEILDQTPVLVVFHRNNLVAAKSKVEGFECAAGTHQFYRSLTKTTIK